VKSLLLKNRFQNSGRRGASYANFGTYGFLSMLLATQMAATPSLFADESAATKVDRAGTDAKKSGRALKRDIKKGARDATGQGSTYEDMKDGAKDAVNNVQDEAGFQKRKAERND
jgi:hypothetical protein